MKEITEEVRAAIRRATGYTYIKPTRQSRKQKRLLLATGLIARVRHKRLSTLNMEHVSCEYDDVNEATDSALLHKHPSLQEHVSREYIKRKELVQRWNKMKEEL
jgi:hypothetical protein